MTRRSLSRLYDRFDSQERFELILAAWSRGDDAEVERLKAKASPSAWRLMDYAPMMMAFQNLAIITYIELSNHASEMTIAWHNADRDWGNEDLNERWSRIALLQGYLLRTKWHAWEKFCSEIKARPTLLAEALPGFDRMLAALAMAHKLVDHDVDAAEVLVRERGGEILTVDAVLKETHEIFESMVKELDW